LYDQRGDSDPRHPGARPTVSCAQAELAACTKVTFLASDSGGDTQIRWQRARVKEWQSGGASASHRPTEHGSPPLTQHRPLPPLPSYLRNLLVQCMLSCTPKHVPHLPNTTLPTKSCTNLHLGSIVITSVGQTTLLWAGPSLIN